MNELIKAENNECVLKNSVAFELCTLENNIKFMKTRLDELKEAIKKEMESRNIIKLETDTVAINYIAPFDKESFDSKAFKKDHADIYDEYVKMSHVKSSIRIKIK